MPEYRSNWNEATRVQMPALVHLTRIGYEYFGKITEDMAGTVYDPDTNILIDVFKTQFAKLNPEKYGEAEAMLRTIRQELDNDDIGESFYKRLKDPGDPVFHGEIIARVLDPCEGTVKSEIVAQTDGIVFFAHTAPMVMGNEVVYKIIRRMHE